MGCPSVNFFTDFGEFHGDGGKIYRPCGFHGNSRGFLQSFPSSKNGTWRILCTSTSVGYYSAGHATLLHSSPKRKPKFRKTWLLLSKSLNSKLANWKLHWKPPKKLERPTTWRIIPQLIVDTGSPGSQWDDLRQNPQVGRAAVVSAKEPCLWRWTLMWLKQCHKPLMTGVTIPPINIVMTGGWFMAVF